MASIWKGSLSFGLVSIPVEVAHRRSGRSHQLPPAPRGRSRRRSSTSASPHPPARPCPGTKSSKATSTRRASSSSSPTKTSRPPRVESSKTLEIVDFVKEERDRSALLRNAVLPRPVQRRRESVRAPARSDPHNAVQSASARSSCARSSISPASRSSTTRSCSRSCASPNELDRHRHAQLSPTRAWFARRSCRWPSSSSTSLAEPFDPTKYTDEYRANLMRVIHAKMKGKKST